MGWYDSFWNPQIDIKVPNRDGEVPSQKELSSYFEELFSSKVLCEKELSSSNEELFPNPDHSTFMARRRQLFFLGGCLFGPCRRLAAAVTSFPPLRICVKN